MNKRYKVLNIIINAITNNNDSIKICFNIFDINNNIKEFYIGNIKDNLIKEYKNNLNKPILKINRFCMVYNDLRICSLCFLRPLNKNTCGNHPQHELDDMQNLLITYTNFYNNVTNKSNISKDNLILYINTKHWI